MAASTTYRSKISKTKKRLSDDRWAVIALTLATMGLLTILTFGLRAVSLASVYGSVPAELPVVPLSVDDPAYHGYKEQPRDELGRFTPAVVLTTEAFYFGELSSFSTTFGASNDKYALPHVDGEPQLATLVDTMDRWVQERVKGQNVPVNSELVLIPSGDIPMPIVIQVIAGLRRSPHFSRVILGGGII